MPVLYEHWRPDLNECFYIGISWAMEETRPYDMDNRNYRHFKVQDELSEQNLVPEVRIQSFPNITEEKLKDLERTYIAYMRSHIGDRLTNIHPGGDLNLGYEWTEYLKTKMSETKKDFHASPEGEKWREEQSIRRQNFHASEEGQAWAIEHSEWLLNFHASPEGKKWREEQSVRRQNFHISENGKEWAKEHSEWLIKFYESLEGEKTIEQIKDTLANFYKSPEGKILKQNKSIEMKSFFATPEGKEISKRVGAHNSSLWETVEHRMKMITKNWYQSNVMYQKYWGA
jgi:hypothetical protein